MTNQTTAPEKHDTTDLFALSPDTIRRLFEEQEARMARTAAGRSNLRS